MIFLQVSVIMVYYPSCHFPLFVPSETIGKIFSDVFRGYRKKPVA